MLRKQQAHAVMGEARMGPSLWLWAKLHWLQWTFWIRSYTSLSSRLRETGQQVGTRSEVTCTFPPKTQTKLGLFLRFKKVYLIIIQICNFPSHKLFLFLFFLFNHLFWVEKHSLPNISEVLRQILCEPSVSQYIWKLAKNMPLCGQFPVICYETDSARICTKPVVWTTNPSTVSTSPKPSPEMVTKLNLFALSLPLDSKHIHETSKRKAKIRQRTRLRYSQFQNNQNWLCVFTPLL